MEILNALWENRDVLFQVLGGIVILASLVVAGTSTPSPDSLLGKFYKAVEFLALNFGKAKDTGTPKV